MSHTKMALITFLDGGPVDPGYGIGIGGNYPSQGLPSGPNYPSGQPVLPPGGVTLPVFPFDPTIDNSLPNAPVRPSQGLPGSQPGIDNSLPSGSNRPSNELPVPGKKYVVKWLACVGLILVPDNTLPSTGAEPKATK